MLHYYYSNRKFSKETNEIVYISNSTYIGCFQDKYFTPILEASYIEEPYMTIQNCLSICEVEGHTFAGLRFGTKCFCDSVITKDLTLLQLQATACNKPCGGNGIQFCGGWLELALYQLDIFPESTTSIEQISSTPTIPLPSTLTMLSISDITTLKSTSTESSTETSDTTALTSMETSVSMSTET
ncbi:unnamed protein product [Mytilus coruscus]|uniref:WSC domain-containing protein n=1 Tax=Mytilus coruscus TaxID=42192 RepID=A0A6J8D2D9_MYTCO|nr:unnamed protein product [Mytilus coruscus]